MNLLLITHDSLLPNFGGHREYLNYWVNSLSKEGYDVTVISWGSESSYHYDYKNLHLVHFANQSTSGFDRTEKSTNYDSIFMEGLLASGIVQLRGMKSRPPVNDILNFVSSKKLDLDLIVKHGPDMSSLGRRLSFKLGRPILERLDWFGMPYKLDKVQEWLEFSGITSIRIRMYIYRIRKMTDLLIKTLEVASLSSNMVYLPSRFDADRLSSFHKGLMVDYIQPTLETTNFENENTRLPFGLDHIKYCMFYGSRNSSTVIALYFLYRVAKSNPEMNFVITGNFGQEAITLHLPNFFILGKVEERIFNNLLKNASFIVLPSIDGHGFQMRLVRGLGMSKPIITTNGTAAPFERIKDEGAIIIKDSPLEFVSSIKDLWNEESLRDTLATKAKNYFKRHFSNKEDIYKFEKIANIAMN